MERVSIPHSIGPAVVVDYAHTPDALDKALAALADYRRQRGGRLVCVIGCGGDRDRGKRPLMAKVACARADVVWLTSDNPRSEQPERIIADMRAGLKDEAVVAEIIERVDRRQAICEALRQSRPHDVVLIAGKGHENYQEIAGRRIDFDDRVVARKVLTEAGVR
jgi:UDP-N-acetylmuramoyl-L-alanyl-D-glutamate--2,6-diaminopimelate ligase